MKKLTLLPLLFLTTSFSTTAVTAELTVQDLAAAESINGVEMTPAEREQMLPDVVELREKFDALHQLEIPNDVVPVLLFEPGFAIPAMPDKPASYSAGVVRDTQEYAYLSVADLGAMLRAGKVSSLELTSYFLARLKKYDPELHLVISYTESYALAEAAKRDAELAAGMDRGPVHGIPYGLKDLFAFPGYPTTWGAMPYKDQLINETATVAQKLADAGAVLIAKTSVGALAWGDVWFDGKTRSPWNIEVGSSGSSAGSAAGVSAGLFPFAIGTETWGSIISPAIRTGISGLRPTFGRVSRSGAMALAWSMDKPGPLCRYIEDCAMVFDAIRGKDGKDLTVHEAGFPYSGGHQLKDFSWGYLKQDFSDSYESRDNDSATITLIKEHGVTLAEKTLPDLPIGALSFVLRAEAAAAFDTLTRSGADDLMVRQIRDAWPNVFRSARYIPAVEYIQAQRVRHWLVSQFDRQLEGVDVILAPCHAGDQVLLTNLTGHPSVVIPNGFDAEQMPTGICLIGKAFEEYKLLQAAAALQNSIKLQPDRPPHFE